jgi:hypothetical protein
MLAPLTSGRQSVVGTTNCIQKAIEKASVSSDRDIYIEYKSARRVAQGLLLVHV